MTEDRSARPIVTTERPLVHSPFNLARKYVDAPSHGEPWLVDMGGIDWPDDDAFLIGVGLLQAALFAMMVAITAMDRVGIGVVVAANVNVSLLAMVVGRRLVGRVG